jgi:predicted TIM-barrel fold metal-dependent hydrolase
MKLFDSLVHATPDGAWISRVAQPATIEYLLAEMQLGEVSRACLVAIDDIVDSEFVRQSALLHPNSLVPVAGLNPRKFLSTPLIASHVRDLSDQGFKGIKLHPRLNRYDPLDELCLSAIKSAGETGLVVFIDTLFDFVPGTPIRHTEDVARVLGYQFPDTKIVLLHGGGTALLNLFEPVRKYKNLILDLSFTLFRYQYSSIDLDLRFILNQLDQRTIIGSDYPEYLPSQLGPRIAELAAQLPTDKLDRIAFDNLNMLFPL